jgi:glc operon protein GlcG
MRSLPLLCAILVSATAVAETRLAAPIPAAYGPPIGTNDALAFIQTGIELSKVRGLKMAIAVVEPTGELVAFVRMDDVPYGSIQLAQQKARTAARFRMTTANAEERVQGGRVALVTADDFVAIGGGVPIVVNNRVVGALGVSGASAAEDAALAAAIVAQK